MCSVSEVIDCGRRCQAVVRTPYLLFFPSLLTTLSEPHLRSGSCCLRGYTTRWSLSTPESLSAPLGRSQERLQRRLEAGLEPLFSLYLWAATRERPPGDRSASSSPAVPSRRDDQTQGWVRLGRIGTNVEISRQRWRRLCPPLHSASSKTTQPLLPATPLASRGGRDTDSYSAPQLATARSSSRPGFLQCVLAAKPARGSRRASAAKPAAPHGRAAS